MKARINRIILDNYEFKKKSKFAIEYKWHAIFWIECFDLDNQQVISDRFYFVVASNNNNEKDLHVDLRQEELDIVEVYDTINKRFAKVALLTIDEFHSEMAKQFLSED